MTRHNNPRVSPVRLLGSSWMALVSLFVVTAAGFEVQRIRAESHAITHPSDIRPIPATVVQINPKNVTYELFGDVGNQGKVSYANLDSEPVEVAFTALPWTVSETTMTPAASLSLVAQGQGDSLGCRIRVNGAVRDEQVVNHASAAVACTVSAA